MAEYKREFVFDTEMVDDVLESIGLPKDFFTTEQKLDYLEYRVDWNSEKFYDDLFDSLKEDIGFDYVDQLPKEKQGSFRF